MAKKRSRGVKPPIIKKETRAALPATVEPPPSISTAGSVSPYLSTVERIASLPTVSIGLTAERVQSVFAHLHFLSHEELRDRERQPNISFLERQAIRYMLKTLRELPPVEVEDLLNGKKQLNKDGTTKMKFKSLHKDQLQNEKQSLDIMKYMQERAFGKPKITIEHQGLPPVQHNHFRIEDVMAAMDNLPRNIVDAIALPMPVQQKAK